jgi:hypothetical protein
MLPRWGNRGDSLLPKEAKNTSIEQGNFHGQRQRCNLNSINLIIMSYRWIYISMTNQTSLDEIETMERKLANFSKKIDEALAEDMLFLRSLNRVTAHCNWALSSMNSNSSFYEDEASSSSNTTTTENSRARSVPVVSPSSAESSGEAHTLFPSAQSQSRSSSSSASTQKQFIRNLANLREERVRKILVEMKGRTERREHESV